MGTSCLYCTIIIFPLRKNDLYLQMTATQTQYAQIYQTSSPAPSNQSVPFNWHNGTPHLSCWRTFFPLCCPQPSKRSRRSRSGLFHQLAAIYQHHIWLHLFVPGGHQRTDHHTRRFGGNIRRSGRACDDDQHDRSTRHPLRVARDSNDRAVFPKTVPLLFPHRGH